MPTHAEHELKNVENALTFFSSCSACFNRNANTCAAPGAVFTTEDCTSGDVYTTGAELHLNVSTVKRPELDVSTQQRPVLHLDVSASQRPEQHLDLSTLQRHVLLLEVVTLQRP